MTRLIALLCACVLLAGCDLPRDPDGTLQRVRGGTLHIGELTGNARALAADRIIANRLAETLGATVETETGEAHALIHRLEDGEFDLIIGGLPAATPFVARAGLSRPAGPLFGAGGDERVIAVRKGENGFLMAVNRAIAKTGEASR